MSGVGWIGELLDGAVHRVMRRFVPTVLPFVLVDAAGSWLDASAPLPLQGEIALLLLIGTVFVQVRVTTIVRAAAAGGAPDGFGARMRLLWRTLPFGVVQLCEYLPVFTTIGLFGVVYVLLTGPTQAARLTPIAVLLIVVVVVFALAVLTFLTAVSLVLPIAGVAALIDTVVDQTPAHRALGRWLRIIVRRREIPGALLAGLGFSLMVTAVPGIVQAIPYVPHRLLAAVSGLPSGIADAIALFFVWAWRDAVLDRQSGRDLYAELDASPRGG